MATSINPMGPTPTSHGMTAEEALYRGAAMACLRRLKAANKGLLIYHGTYQLPGGVEVFCNVCGNREDVYVRVPAISSYCEVAAVIPECVFIAPDMVFSVRNYNFEPYVFKLVSVKVAWRSMTISYLVNKDEPFTPTDPCLVTTASCFALYAAKPTTAIKSYPTHISAINPNSYTTDTTHKNMPLISWTHCSPEIDVITPPPLYKNEVCNTVSSANSIYTRSMLNLIPEVIRLDKYWYNIQMWFTSAISTYNATVLSSERIYDIAHIISSCIIERTVSNETTTYLRILYNALAAESSTALTFRVIDFKLKVPSNLSQGTLIGSVHIPIESLHLPDLNNYRIYFYSGRFGASGTKVAFISTVNVYSSGYLINDPYCMTEITITDTTVTYKVTESTNVTTGNPDPAVAIILCTYDGDVLVPLYHEVRPQYILTATDTRTSENGYTTGTAISETIQYQRLKCRGKYIYGMYEYYYTRETHEVSDGLNDGSIWTKTTHTKWAVTSALLYDFDINTNFDVRYEEMNGRREDPLERTIIHKEICTQGIWTPYSTTSTDETTEKLILDVTKTINYTNLCARGETTVTPVHKTYALTPNGDLLSPIPDLYIVPMGINNTKNYVTPYHAAFINFTYVGLDEWNTASYAPPIFLADESCCMVAVERNKYVGSFIADMTLVNYAPAVVYQVCDLLNEDWYGSGADASNHCLFGLINSATGVIITDIPVCNRTLDLGGGLVDPASVQLKINNVVIPLLYDSITQYTYLSSSLIWFAQATIKLEDGTTVTMSDGKTVTVTRTVYKIPFGNLSNILPYR